MFFGNGITKPRPSADDVILQDNKYNLKLLTLSAYLNDLSEHN